MLAKIKDLVSDDNELDGGTLRLLSLIFLSICGGMAFFEYVKIIDWWFDAKLTFKPGLISTIIAIALISPLYVRGILKWNKSVYTILSLMLILLVFASFVELALGGNEKNNIIYALIGSAVVLSWLGMKAIAGISWALALFAAIYSAIINNIAMGFYGYVYISSGFIGLILHSGLNPGGFYQGIKEEFSSSASGIGDTVKNDINVTTQKIT